MKVDRVFTRNVVGTSRSASLEAAARLMRTHHVGALLVSDDPPREGDAIGVLTDRDMVVQAIARGLDARSLTVGSLMTPMVGTISRHADLHEALGMMRAAGVRRLVVTGDGGRVAGMLSLDDVVDGIAADVSALAGVAKNEVENEREELDAAGAELCAVY